jgi:hypothetical protein
MYMNVYCKLRLQLTAEVTILQMCIAFESQEGLFSNEFCESKHTWVLYKE